MLTVRNSSFNSNGGASIVATNTRVLVDRSTFSNGASLGIDLLAPDLVTGVTLNDPGDLDIGASGLLNFPVLTQAYVLDDTLTVEGVVAAGAEVQLYLADENNTSWGVGREYLLSLVEGSEDDFDVFGSEYNQSVAGFQVGADTAEGFQFNIPLSELPTLDVNAVNRLTALAIVDGVSSEFSNPVLIE